TLDQRATLGGEELRRGCEPIALFHQELAALDPFLEGRGDGATAEDVQTQIVDEIESAGRTDVVAAPGNVDAQRGKFVVTTAVLPRRDGVVEAVSGEDPMLGGTQHRLCPSGQIQHYAGRHIRSTLRWPPIASASRRGEPMEASTG